MDVSFGVSSNDMGIEAGIILVAAFKYTPNMWGGEY